MTVVSNIHVGLSAWSNSTYAVATRVSTGGNAYQCIVAGTSTSAPTGTGSAVNNGGVAVWKWLSAVDYTSVQAWADAWPGGALSDNLEGRLWNDGTITTTAGTTLLNTTSTTTVPGSFTITLTCAPGESFRDRLRDNGLPLAFSTTAGVSFSLPNAVGGVNYFLVTIGGFIFDGLQFQDPLTTSTSGIIDFELPAGGGVGVIRNCIIDGTAQDVAAVIVMAGFGNHNTIENCLLIDHSGASDPISYIFTGNATAPLRLVNCTIVSVAPNTTGTIIAMVEPSNITADGGCFYRNCLIMGWRILASTNFSGYNVDHSVITNASPVGAWTDAGGNVTGATLSNQVVNTTTDFRLKRLSDCINAGTTDSTDVPTSNDIALRPRPSGSAWDAGAWEFNADGPVPRPLVGVQQEYPVHPTHPRSRLWSQHIVAVPSQTNVRRDVITRQEQPSHPSPRLQVGVQGPNVRGTATDTILGRQEQPLQPPSRFLSGVWPRSVRVPVTDAIVGRQQLPDHPLPTLRQTIYGQNVRPAIDDNFIITQELPSHPRPTMGAGVQGPNVGVPVTSSISTRQEMPFHPGPFVLQVVYGLNVRPPTTDVTVTRQQLPDHPLPIVRAGVQGPNVAAQPQIGAYLGRQEQPRHPLPFVSAGIYIPLPPQAPFPLGDSALLRQEQPRHPLPTMGAGVQGPNVRPAVSDALVTRQEQPPWLQPLLLQTLYGQNVRISLVDTVLIRQEQPYHPLPNLQPSPQTTNVRASITDTVILRQEQPGHPLPQMRPSIQGPNVHTKVLDAIVGRQEQPGHPPPILYAGPQGPNVLTKMVDSYIGRQELPGHPLPWVAAGVRPANVAPAGQIGGVLGRQQYPDHPLPVLRTGVLTVRFIPPVTNYVLTRQEQPWHPSPLLVPAQFSNRPFVRGRTVTLRADV